MFCGKCGAKVIEGQDFCHKCGADLSAFKEENNENTEQTETVKYEKSDRNETQSEEAEAVNNDGVDNTIIMNQLLHDFNKIRIGLILSEIHLLVFLFAFFVGGRINVPNGLRTIIYALTSLSWVIGLVLNLVFAGPKTTLNTAKSIITLNGNIVFTIWGIPMMLFLFIFTLIILPYIPLIAVLVRYHDEKNDFEDLCMELRVVPDDADEKVKKTSTILKLSIPLLVVAGIAIVIWGLSLKAAAKYRPTEVEYEATSVENNVDSTVSEQNNSETNPNRKLEGEVDGYSWKAVGDEIHITDYLGTDNREVIELPAKIEGYPVTTIEDYVFSGHEEIKELKMPSSITAIGKEAFSRCTALSSIEWSNNLASIGEQSFAYCDSIEILSLPQSVETIGRASFGACKSLKTVDLGGTVNIGPYAFSQDVMLVSVVLNEGLKVIGEYAFDHCEALTEIDIPSSVEDIGGYAFIYAPLEKVTLSEGSNSAKIGNSAFNFTKIVSMTIPGNYVELGDFVLEDSTLEEVIWEENKNGESQTMKHITSMNKKPVAFHGGATITNIDAPKLNDRQAGKEVTIYGPAGSYLEEYANEKGHPFIAE